MSGLMAVEVEAHQQINNMVRGLTSSKQKLKIVQMVTIIGITFAFFSIGGSGYGIYYDMLLDYGFSVSLAVGLLGGLVIEAVKMLGVWLMFAYPQLHIKLIGFTLLSLFTAFAIQLHFIGATNMEYTKRAMVLQDIHDKNLAIQARKLDRDEKVIDLMGDVLNNGTSVDDKLATRTISEIDKQANNMKMSELDRMLYNETKEGARKRGNSMRKLLPLFEIFSIFGLLGAYLKTQSVNEDVKGVIRAVDTHIEDESSIVYAQNAVKSEVSPTVAHVEKILKESKSIVPTQKATTGIPDINDLTPEQKAEIMAILRKKSNVEATAPEETLSSPSETKEEISTTKKLISPTFQQRNEDECEELEYEEVVSVEKEYEKAIDFSAFSEQEGVLIKILWNNGSIQPGDDLIDRNTVIREARDNFGISRAGSILTNLYDNLENDHKMIERPKPNKGYKAKVALKKELWTEKQKIA